MPNNETNKDRVSANNLMYATGSELVAIVRDINSRLDAKDSQIRQLEADCAAYAYAIQDLLNNGAPIMDENGMPDFHNSNPDAARKMLKQPNPGAKLLEELATAKREVERLRDVIVECSGCANAVHTEKEAAIAIQYIRGRLNDALDAAMQKGTEG